MQTAIYRFLIATLTIFLVVDSNNVEACTTAVISGKATIDGRPLLWKNRDYSVIDNELIVIDGGKFRGIAIVNKGSNKSIWMGCNDQGFCIENSVSNDLKDPSAKGGLGNGSFMLKAIQTCSNMTDFEKLLKETDQSGRATTANFGVIDAQGGAAIFETSPRSHKKFDANDPTIAPHGFVVRSNFSFEGQKLEGCSVSGDGSENITDAAQKNLEKVQANASGQRFLRARALLTDAVADKVSAEFILKSCMKDMANEKGQAFDGSVNGKQAPLPELIPTATTISRTTTVSACCFVGVKPGEDPSLTTMWSVLGDPKFSLAVPAWPNMPATAKVMNGGSTKNGSSLCTDSLALRAFYFDKSRKGIHTNGLSETFDQLGKTQDYIITATNHELESWRKSGINQKAALEFHTSMAKQAATSLARQVKRHASRPPIFIPLPADSQPVDEEAESEQPAAAATPSVSSNR